MRPAIAIAVVSFALVLSAARTSRAEVSRPALMQIADDGARVELPLVRGHCHVEVRGPIAQVKLTQTYANPGTEPIEAVYVFPLPDDGAVGGMTMKVDDRTIRATIRRRDEARAVYEKAKAEGKTSALLEQERPNVFTQSVANILGGEEIEVALTYDVLLAPADSVYELAVPTVVGPRYVNERVADPDRISPPVAAPGTATGNTLGFDLDLEAGLPITEIYSPTHTIVTAEVDSSHYRIGLAESETVANKDFVLRWRIEVTSPALAVLAHKAEGAELGHLALIVQPPAAAPASQAGKRELVFVVDTSGSMEGKPLALARQAIRYALERLGEGDAFRIFKFSDGVSGFRDGELQRATPENLRAARRYVDDLESDGGTEMIHAVKAALAGEPAAGRTRYVSFMTDGYIGNETEILAAIDAQIDPATYLFSFGVGSSVNRYLLDGLAEHGGGVAHYLLPDEAPEPQIEDFFTQLDTPLLGHLRIAWDGLDVVDPAPSTQRHLFAGQPVVVSARYRRGGKATVEVTGRRGDQDVTLRIPVVLPDQGGDGDVLARLWARRRIHELDAGQVGGERDEVVDEITEIALAHSLMSRYTSFVAVEERRRSDGDPTRVDVPVELPDGVSPNLVGATSVVGSWQDISLTEGDVMYSLAGASAAESIYLYDPSRRWRAALSLGAGLDTAGDTGYLAVTGSTEARITARNAVGVTATMWDRNEHARMLGLLGTVGRWAIFGLFDLRFGVGPAFVPDEGGGLAWQLRMGLPIPVGKKVHPELELRFDRVHLGEDEDLVGVGGGLGLRF
jgi:Ca-activated chloride channel family protein